MKHRLQRNIMVLFLCCSALPLALVTAIGHFSSTRSIHSMMLRQTAFSCREIEERFSRTMRRLEDLFLFLASRVSPQIRPGPARPFLREGGLESVVEDLLIPGKYDRDFSGFVILEADGRPRYRINYQSGVIAKDGRSQYYLQEDHFEAGDRRGLEVASKLGADQVRVVYPDPAEVNMNLRLVASLFLEGRRVGFFLGDVDAGSLLESIISNMSLGKDAFFLVTDSRSGVVLSHPDPSKRNQLLSVALPKLSDTLLQGPPEGWQRFRDEEGRLWILSSRRLPQTPWQVSVAGPLGVYLAPIHRVGWLSLFLVLGALSVTTLFLVLSTRRFRRSLASLTGAAERFSSGDLEDRVEVESRDEMGALADTFNRMAHQLQNLIRQREESARFDSFHRLSAAVAHDLKGSLFSLSLLMENLEKRLDNPAFLHDSARTIRSAVEKMKKTIGKLSEKPTQRSQKKVRHSLSPLLDGILKSSGLTQHASLRIEKELDPAAEIVGDPEETERLFLNLLHNAVESMPEGGTLRVSCRLLPGSGHGNGWVEAVVQDTGRGMTAEFLREKIFRPFSSTRRGGIGLGLYTCKEIVSSQGGRIEVESEPGKGSRFLIRFPAAGPG